MALQKIRDLLDCKARVHLVAPAAARCIEDIESHPGFRWSKRLPCEKDVSESYLVFASEELREMADRHGRLYNALDHRELCHFTNPSVARNAPLVVAISTGGSSPVLGQFLRDRIRSEILTDTHASFARFLGQYRKRIRSLIPDYGKRREFYQSLIDTGFIGFLRDTNEEEALSELIRRVAEYRKEKGYEEEAVR
jgi:uroporphyrin-III C-methyltransferase/precorrin-2 dehydrogenase/sirohydrochlorin ferrochelatase